MRSIGNAIRCVLVALWGLIRWIGLSIKRAILWACNAFWCFLLRRGENAEQRLIKDLNREIDELRDVIEANREQARKASEHHAYEIRCKQNEITALEKQQELLVAVLRRNLERVEAEIAIASRARSNALHSPFFNNGEQGEQG